MAGQWEEERRNKEGCSIMSRSMAIPLFFISPVCVLSRHLYERCKRVRTFELRERCLRRLQPHAHNELRLNFPSKYHTFCLLQIHAVWQSIVLDLSYEQMQNSNTERKHRQQGTLLGISTRCCLHCQEAYER